MHRAACRTKDCPSGLIRCGGICTEPRLCRECWDVKCPVGQACRDGACAPCTSPSCGPGRHIDDHCTCVCDAEPRACPGSSFWDLESCACSCDPNRVCPASHHLDEKCDCLCDTVQECPADAYWDDRLCRCLCVTAMPYLTWERGPAGSWQVPSGWRNELCGGKCCERCCGWSTAGPAVDALYIQCCEERP